jgi:hypothetical protein
MGIGLAILLLTYVILLVMAYLVMILTTEKEERSLIIINQAYNHAFSVFFFGILIVITLIKLPTITFDHQTTSYLLLTSKFLSALTLGISTFMLRKYFYK